MVETFTRNDVFHVDWDFFLGGRRLIFFKGIMVLRRLRLFPVS